jgi:hypothetical protein
MSRNLKNTVGALTMAAALAVTVTACQSEKSASAPAAHGAGAKAAAPTRSATSARAAAPKGIGNGTLIVGKDIQPGTYKAIATDEDGGYWEREKDTSGSMDSILANDDLDQGDQAVVTILPTDKAFKSSGMGGWVPASGPSLTGGKLRSGTLIVGVDIQPGTYTATVTDEDGGYWERDKDATGSADSILANDDVDAGNKATVTISASDKVFKSTGFGPWTKS